MDTNLLWLTWVLIVVGGLALGVGIGWGARRYGQRWIEKNNRT